jgi:hypothetical protein
MNIDTFCAPLVPFRGHDFPALSRMIKISRFDFCFPVSRSSRLSRHLVRHSAFDDGGSVSREGGCFAVPAFSALFAFLAVKIRVHPVHPWLKNPFHFRLFLCFAVKIPFPIYFPIRVYLRLSPNCLKTT